MRLENLVMQARDSQRLGDFWTKALGLVDTHVHGGTFEGRLLLGDGLFLDVCIETVDTDPAPDPRLHPDLLGGADQQRVVERLLSLGASHADIGQDNVPWVVMADPEGNPFCVMEHRSIHTDTGPIAALPLDSLAPERDAALYEALTGWVRVPGAAEVSLRHASLRGPLLEFCARGSSSTRQNRLHLDVRPEAGDPTADELAELAESLGAQRIADDWAHGHPWIVMRDTSGNEFCILARDERSPSSAESPQRRH